MGNQAPAGSFLFHLLFFTPGQHKAMRKWILTHAPGYIGRKKEKRRAICFNVTHIRHTSRPNNLLSRKFLPSLGWTGGVESQLSPANLLGMVLLWFTWKVLVGPEYGLLAPNEFHANEIPRRKILARIQQSWLLTAREYASLSFFLDCCYILCGDVEV